LGGGTPSQKLNYKKITSKTKKVMKQKKQKQKEAAPPPGHGLKKRGGTREGTDQVTTSDDAHSQPGGEGYHVLQDRGKPPKANKHRNKAVLAPKTISEGETLTKYNDRPEWPEKWQQIEIFVEYDFPPTR